MWSLIKTVLVKWALLRILLKSFGSLAWLLPVALLLKAFGWPVLVVLLVLALPVLVMLALFGLPALGVVLVGGMLLSVLGWVLTMGLMVLKIVLPIVAVVWVLRWLTRGDDRPRGGATPAEGAAPA